MTISSRLRSSVILTSAFAAAILLMLYVTYRGSYFCTRPGDRALIYPLLVATAMIVSWHLFTRLLARAAGLVLSQSRDVSSGTARRISNGLAILTFALGMLAAPEWIYIGAGHFRFETTVADVACLFTEGNGYAWIVVVAPIATLAMLAKQRLQRRFVSQESR